MNTNKEFILQNENVAKAIFSITPFTLLDYPHKTACILWFAGCNMRCLYCYNPEIVLGKGKISFDEVLTFLKTRKELLDGVVLSGGECTSHKNLIPFLKNVKDLGFSVKIDTNGTNPQVLEEIINKSLVDYIALDFKAIPDTFEKITQSNLFDAFEKSLNILLDYKVKFEIRTTYHSDLISNIEIKKMIQFLEQKGYIGYYYFQNYVNNKETIGNLNYSTKIFEIENLGTKNIKIEIR